MCDEVRFNVADELPRYRSKDFSKIMHEDALLLLITHDPSLITAPQIGKGS